MFLACTLAIAVVGTWITGVADQFADRAGIGEALTGAVLLGASTSLGGAVVSVTAALDGNADLAMGNALGGIGVQFAALAIADFAYRRANLEHAAASPENLMQSALLIALLALILLAPTLPESTLWGIHPVTPVMLALYGYGIRLIRGVREHPMWQPRRTLETREDEPEKLDRVPGLLPLTLQFLGLMAALGVAGFTLEKAASNIAEATWLSATAVGVLFTAVSTSLPELVTSVAAVRRGALTLAVGGIIGGNAYDTLFSAAADVAYREGSIYHAMPDSVSFWAALSLLMAAVLTMGLIRRELQGPGGVGKESMAILLLYAAGVAILLWSG
ncbi:MAG: sodium:calcium antiporter [Candidatus Wenzhouxiangella sp. M2_3B_020]